MLSAKSFFSFTDFSHPDLFDVDGYVWSGLNNLKSYMDNYSYPNIHSSYFPANGAPLVETVIVWNDHVLSAHNIKIDFGDTTKGALIVTRNNKILEGASVVMAGATLIGRKIALGKGVLIENGAMVKSPAIIGNQTEVRQGAYLRGYVLTGKHCVVGHTTEVKHSIFFNHAKAGHFNYLGDSILGTNANLGAGTKFANLKFLPGNVLIRTKDGNIDTGRRKFGAILGDKVQTGCNSVTNPGTLLGIGSMVMPNTTTPSGYHPKQTIIRP